MNTVDHMPNLGPNHAPPKGMPKERFGVLPSQNFVRIHENDQFYTGDLALDEKLACVRSPRIDELNGHHMLKFFEAHHGHRVGRLQPQVSNR